MLSVIITDIDLAYADESSRDKTMAGFDVWRWLRVHWMCGKCPEGRVGNFQAFYQQGDRVERNILAGPSSSADCLSGAVYGFITETRLYHSHSIWLLLFILCTPTCWSTPTCITLENTFDLLLYSIGQMVMDHSDNERGNPLPLHGLFSISSKGYFICTIPQTG